MSEVVKKKIDELAGAVETPTRPLSMVIDKLRSELAALRDDAKDKDLQFRVGEIEVELQVGITANAKGEIGFDCWLYKAGAEAGIERASTQTIKLKLTPSIPAKDGKADHRKSAGGAGDLKIKAPGARSK